jgi:MYXO-CTERM domain-containing protein
VTHTVTYTLTHDRLVAPIFASSLLSLLAAAAVTFTSGAAHAGPSCSKNSDCLKGFLCQTSSAVACPEIACAPNEPCIPPVCDTTPVSACVPGPCSADSDCATGMACVAQAQNCATPATPPCAAGATCPTVVVDAGACGSTVKQCIPRYDLPCQADSDCGSGFTCKADQECGCAGSGGTSGTGSPPVGTTTTTGAGAPDQPAPAVDGGAAPPSCSCTNLPTSHCEINVINCQATGDCPAQWSCVAPPSAATGCAVSASVDGAATTTNNCTPVVTDPGPSVCEPPYADLGIGQSFGGANGSTPTAAGSPKAVSDVASTTPGQNDAGGGCQMGSGPADVSVGAWAGLFGLAAFARRRRGQRA